MMELHSIIRSRVPHPAYFRVDWNPIHYSCREDNGSLKPVPPGTTRRALYCGDCTAAHCLFGNGHGRPVPAPAAALRQPFDGAQDRAQGVAAEAVEEPPPKVKPSGWSTAAARMRRQGLNQYGRSLARTCWNCVEIRATLTGYVCGQDPEGEPVSRGVAVKRYADGCPTWQLRRVMDIPELEV